LNRGRIRLNAYSVTGMYGRVKHWEAKALIRAAHGLGAKGYDTADNYGHALAGSCSAAPPRGLRYGPGPEAPRESLRAGQSSWTSLKSFLDVV